MRVRIPEERNPFGRRRPFDVLGVDPAASFADVRGAYEELVAQVDSAGLQESERTARLAELEAAYEVLREPRSRALVEMSRIDDELGLEACREAARAHADTSLDCDAVLEREEGLPPAEPELSLPEGPSRAASLATRMRLKTEGARFVPDLMRDVIESVTFER
jgi:hypothetical protein